MKKQFNLFCLILLIMSASIHGILSYDLSSFQEPKFGGNIGIVHFDKNPYIKTGLSPNLEFKGLELGFDLNLFIPLDSDVEKPDELATIAFRHVGYNYYDTFGFKWGRLNSVTMGYGLLVNNYNSGMLGSTEFNSDKAGVLTHLELDRFRFEAMYTATQVAATRVQIETPYAPFLDVPIYVGGTFAKDLDGVDEVVDNQTITRGETEGYAVDVALPIGGDLFTVYTEYSHLTDFGGGATAGFRGNFFNLLKYQFGYIRYGEGFVPRYFDQTYETTSTPAGLSEDQNGFLAGLEGNWKIMRFGGEYENVGDRHISSLSLGWSEFQNTVGVINYIIPLQGSEQAVAQADIGYNRGGALNYVFHIKRVYVKGEPVDSYSVSTQVDLGQLF